MPVSYTLFADITFNANSKEKQMKIALAQLNYTIGDIGGNTAKSSMPWSAPNAKRWMP